MRALADGALVIGLGGNVGGEEAVLARFRSAAEALAAWGRLRRSSVYRTAPIGGVAQGGFLNGAVVVALSDPSPLPREIIEVVQEIERLLGRDRGTEARWGPRAIDLDVLLWGPRCIDWIGPPRLEVPHPRLQERRFALEPVIELVGEDVEIPGTGRTLGEMYGATGEQGVQLSDLRW